MAVIDGDIPSVYMTPAPYSRAQDSKKPEDTKRGGKTRFSSIFDDIRTKGAEDFGPLGPLADLPVSEETLNVLMDEGRSAGDTLRDRPFPEEILRYKKAVRDFMHYIVENCYSLEHEAGIQKFERPGYKGPLWTDEAKKRKAYTKVQVIDKKLEDMAAMLLSGQKQQLEIAARLEEIKGLLIDLLE
jgi:uncharacterized protein YaaR (DUF327 family)